MLNILNLIFTHVIQAEAIDMVIVIKLCFGFFSIFVFKICMQLSIKLPSTLGRFEFANIIL